MAGVRTQKKLVYGGLISLMVLSWVSSCGNGASVRGADDDLATNVPVQYTETPMPTATEAPWDGIVPAAVIGKNRINDLINESGEDASQVRDDVKYGYEKDGVIWLSYQKEEEFGGKRFNKLYFEERGWIDVFLVAMDSSDPNSKKYTFDRVLSEAESEKKQDDTGDLGTSHPLQLETVIVIQSFTSGPAVVQVQSPDNPDDLIEFAIDPDQQPDFMSVDFSLPLGFATPRPFLPEDMPQGFKDKLAEWDYSVSGETVSVDGEVWFQRNVDLGEWEKVYYEKDGLRWTPSDLFDGRIMVNPEKAKEIYDGHIDFFILINRNDVLRHRSGTDVILVPTRDESRRITALAKEVDPVDTSVITIEYPSERNSNVFLEDGLYVPLVDTMKNHHAGVQMSVDDENHLVFSYVSYTQVENEGNIPLSKKGDPKQNDISAEQIMNHLLINKLVRNVHAAIRHVAVKFRPLRGQLFPNVSDDIDGEPVSFVNSQKTTNMILADPSLLMDAGFVEENIIDQSVITVEDLYNVLIVNAFLPRSFP